MFLIARNFLFTYSIYIFLLQSQYSAITWQHPVRLSTYLRLTKYVILAKYCLWLPDDGFLLNRNMVEHLYLF